MFIPINNHQHEAVIEANQAAITAFRKCPIGYFSGTPRFIYHKLLVANEKSLRSLVASLKRIKITEYKLNQEIAIDAIGLSHTFTSMECEDEIVMDEAILSERVLTILEILKNSSIEYVGWSCSDTAGSGASDSNDSNHPYSDDLML